MESLSCIFNVKTLIEAFIIGCITFIIGKVTFNMTINKKNNDEPDETPRGLDLSFFITGFLLHFFVEIIGLNKWYCDKKCVSGLINISKLGN